MIIKTDSGIVVADLLIMTILDIVLFWVFDLFSRDFNANIPGLVVIIMNSVLWVSDMVFNGRTLVIDSEGCLVSFGPYRKRYNWSDLQTRRMEYYCRGGKGYRGVIFSKKKYSFYEL